MIAWWLLLCDMNKQSGFRNFNEVKELHWWLAFQRLALRKYYLRVEYMLSLSPANNCTLLNNDCGLMCPTVNPSTETHIRTILGQICALWHLPYSGFHFKLFTVVNPVPSLKRCLRWIHFSSKLINLRILTEHLFRYTCKKRKVEYIVTTLYSVTCQITGTFLYASVFAATFQKHSALFLKILWKLLIYSTIIK